MGTRELMAFLREREAEQKKPELQAALKSWLKDLHELFARIEGWMRSLTEEGLGEVNFGECRLDDDPYGSYEVPVLRLHLPGSIVRCEPVALSVVGAQGRVDVFDACKKRHGARNFMLLRYVTDFDAEAGDECTWKVGRLEGGRPRPAIGGDKGALTQELWEEQLIWLLS